MGETERKELKEACRKEKDPMAVARMLAVHMYPMRNPSKPHADKLRSDTITPHTYDQMQHAKG